MKNDNIFFTGGKFFTTFFMLLVLVSSLYAKPIVFTFTGTTLKEDLRTYLLMQKYIEDNSKFKVEIKFARNYAEVISSIKNDKTDIAYICGSTFSILKDNAKLLVVPTTNGQKTYHADIVALKNSTYKSLYDFKGKTFAFTDPESTTGSISPMYYLIKKGYKFNNFFKQLIYTYDHGESIEAVLSGFVDGASVDSLVYTQYIKKHPNHEKDLRIVEKLGPYTISPIVAKSKLDEKTFQALQEVFVNMSTTPEGKKILSNLSLDKFEKPSNQSYDAISDMLQYIKINK